MAAWEDELRKLDLTRRVEQIEEDAHRGVNFLGLKVLYAEPSRTFAGMIVYADGTSWNPGSGEGFYRRNKDNDGWVYTTSFGTVTVDESGYLRGGQTDYATGTGFFLGHSGGAYKFSIGSTTNYFRWDGSAITLRGNITGTSEIDITGRASFDGTGTVGAVTASVFANSSMNAVYAVYGWANSSGARGALTGVQSGSGSGILGDCTGGTGTGARGISGSGIGVWGSSTTGIGGQFAGAKAVSLTGTFEWGGYNWASPDGTTKLFAADGTWVSASSLDAGKVDGYDAGNASGNVPVSNGTVNTNLNADMVDGYHAGNSSGQVAVSNGTKCTNLYAALAEALYNGGNNYAMSGTPTTGTATATFPGTDKPGSNSSVQWLTLAINGTTYYLPVWT